MFRDPRLPLLLACFFVSGFAALIYQTAWTTQFSYVFGTSELAVATVLAAYMGGLALGAAVASRLGPRVRRPVLAYGLLELGIALAALAIPAAIDASTSLYVAAFGGHAALAGEGGLARAAYYLASSFAILLVPTALMGATLPLLIRHAVRRESEIGSRVALLYAVNTLGAVGGTLLAGFVLLPVLGLGGTIWVAIGGNLLVFAAAAALARGAPTPPPAPPPSRAAPLPTARAWVLPLMMISGAVSFTYEVLWTRLLAHLLGGSVYAFATMLGSFLAGIAIGAALAGRIATSPESAARGFAWLQIGTALLSLAAFLGLNAVPDLAYAVGLRSWDPVLADAVVAAATLLPSTLCIGGTFPLAVRILARDEASATPASARVYAWNTVGAVLGAVGAGFVIVPTLGYAGAVVLAIAANLGLALATTCFAGNWRRPAAWVAAAGLLALAVARPEPPWNLLRSSPLAQDARQGRVLYYAVGRGATVLLIEQNALWTLWTNGLLEAVIEPAGARPGSFGLAQWLTGGGSLARPEARSLLVIGFGGGVALEAIPSAIESIDVVEIEPEVIAANRVVASRRRRDPLADPRLEVVFNDARGALELTSRRYDVIASQPSHPWTAGSSHLYTREFFELVREHLTPSGVFIQWMGLHYVDQPLLQTLVATLLGVFPSVEVYQIGTGIVFLASNEALDMEAGARRAVARAPADFAAMGVFGPEDAAALRILDEAGARAFSAGAPLNTDDRNLLAMRSPAIARRGDQPLDLDAAVASLDPLTGPTPQLDRVYVVRRLLDLGAGQRAARVARATRDPDARAVAEALVKAAEGRRAAALEALQGVIRRNPEYRKALLALLSISPEATGRDGAAAGVFSRLENGPAAVLVGRQLGAAQDWSALEALDEELAQVTPRDLVYPEAARLRASWRLAGRDRDRAREAMTILDAASAPRSTVSDAVLRAHAAAVAGDSAGAHQILLSVLPYLKETPAHRPVARRALAVLAMAPPQAVSPGERAQLERRLRRIARAGP